MYEDDEIYDDTGDTSRDMTEPGTGLSAIKARFEQAQNKFDSSPSPGPKPGPTLKPKPFPKYGGGGGLKICATGDKKDDAGVPNATTPKSAIKQENDVVTRDKTSNTSSGGPIKKRDSKVNIPEAFRIKTEGPSTEIKPKPGIKSNKWASDSNNNARVNGVTSAKNIEIIENAFTHKKPNIAGIAKRADSENTAAGKVSPREKATDKNIPKNHSDTPKAKTSPRGVGTGIDVLAKVAGSAGDSNAPVDFRSKLKHVEQNKNSPIAVGLSHKKVDFRNDSTDSKDVPWRKNLKSAKFRESTKSVRSVIRVLDGKKFHKVDNSSLGDGSSPEKPEKLDCDIDLEALETQFKEAIENIDATEKEQHGWTEVEEEYDDCGNLRPVSSRVVSLMGNCPKPKPRKGKKVPLIEPMTEDEELSEHHWKHAGFEGLSAVTEEFPAPPPELLDEQETYDDVGVAEAVPAEEEGLEQDEMYEELPDEPAPESPPAVGPKPPAIPPELPTTPLPKIPEVEKSDGETKPVPEQTADAKEQKRLEKERKKKEKEEKKLLENREKELKKLLKVLGNKVTAAVLTTSVGKGKVKANAKGKEKTGDLTVNEGEEVDIIRMIDNPVGKWLVRILSSQKDKEQSHGPYSPLDLIGYCDEKNIEVDTSSILNYMTGSGGQNSSPSTASLEQDGETYEAVDGDEGLVEDEIYEECN